MASFKPPAGFPRVAPPARPFAAVPSPGQAPLPKGEPVVPAPAVPFRAVGLRPLSVAMLGKPKPG